MCGGGGLRSATLGPSPSGPDCLGPSTAKQITERQQAHRHSNPFLLVTEAPQFAQSNKL
jgi:hypothetical protein